MFHHIIYIYKYHHHHHHQTHMNQSQMEDKPLSTSMLPVVVVAPEEITAETSAYYGDCSSHDNGIIRQAIGLRVW